MRKIIALFLLVSSLSACNNSAEVKDTDTDRTSQKDTPAVNPADTVSHVPLHDSLPR